MSANQRFQRPSARDVATRYRVAITSWMLVVFTAAFITAAEPPLRNIPLQSKITRVQPLTGMVLWTTNENNNGDWIQLEYAYIRYDDVIRGKDNYDWSVIDNMLADIASRRHQAVLRFYFVYPGQQAAVPAFVKTSPGYEEIAAKSEGKETSFCDWRCEVLQQTTLDFYTAFAARYDTDPRLAYLQTGFGLWAEYHIYDGPMELGKTFPSKAFQAAFANHLTRVFKQTPWSISIDAADDSRSPMAQDASLRALSFGLFDDSFLHKKHNQYNANAWAQFGRERWKKNPAGGELSYYSARDQKLALSEHGPHAMTFEKLAADYHISYMIGDDQPEYQTRQRIAEAGMALGYRFRITAVRSAPSLGGPARSEVVVTNEGIAPIYHDAFVAVDSVRASETLRGLLPGETKTFMIPAGSDSPTLTIQSDRLVPGQTIEFNASIGM